MNIFRNVCKNLKDSIYQAVYVLKGVGGKIDKKQRLILVNIVIMLAMGILHAMDAGHYVNFYPINGTFQDYNPIRRFLSGQVPYRDFQDYLGMGHLYLGTIFTGLLGGKYRASLIAFRFVAFLSTALIFYVVSSVVLKNEKAALMVSNILLVVLLIQPTFLNTIVGDEKIKDALGYAMSTGNSARMLRGGIVPICVLCVLKFRESICKRANDCKKISALTYLCMVGGLFAGFSFQWSNDYGISSWLCILLMIFYLILARYRDILLAFKGTIVALCISIVSCFVFVSLFTLGNFSNWFFSTFGTGGYQAWYYIGEKSYYITDVDFSYIMLIQAFLAVFYLYKVWTARADYYSIIRYGVLAYMNITAFCAVNEYKLLSGGSSREVALVILFVTIISELINYIGKTSLRENASSFLGKVSLVVCLAWILGTLQSEIRFDVFEERQGVHIEAMGGNMTELGEDILATDEFLGDAKTFATYSSGQELVSGNFQPSGIDYLIHVLGDSQRVKYLNSFERDDFDYAVTINESFTNWEYWLQRANWFFYQSLFANWHPVYANSYEVYWERNSKNDNLIYTGDVDVSVESTDTRALKVVVNTDESISGVANVYIDYEAQKDDGLTRYLIFTSMVNEKNTGECFCDDEGYESTNIRSSGKEYIPVTIVDGYGEVTLTAQPEKSMLLTINEVSCEEIYEVQFKYLCIDEYEEGDEQYVLHIAESNRANKIAQSIKYIYIDEAQVPIADIEDGNIVIDKKEIRLEEDFLKNGNVFEVGG